METARVMVMETAGVMMETMEAAEMKTDQAK
jgi:hypothetical protein